MGFQCFRNNERLKVLEIPELEEMWDGCFYCNKSLKQLIAPKLIYKGKNCFKKNKHIQRKTAFQKGIKNIWNKLPKHHQKQHSSGMEI